MDAPLNNAPLSGKASFTFWLLAALLLLIVALVGFSLFGPNPPIEIGKATTHITTPLDANGLPDYAAALLAESRKGVTLENNGAVPFLMAMWPKEGSDEAYSAEDAKLLCAEIGLPGVPPVEGRITSLDSDKYRLAALRLLRERMPKPKESSKKSTGTDPDDVAMFREEGMEEWIEMEDELFFNSPESIAVKDGRVANLLYSCEPTESPWTTEELPFLADWLEGNDAAIDLLVEAAERPEWHFPSPSLLKGGNGVMFGVLGNITQLREAAYLLKTRCGFHQGEGEYVEAAREVIAILRLAHHTSKGPLVIDQLVAIAIGGMGLRKINQITADESMSITTLRLLLKEIDLAGPFSRMAYSLDHGERFYCLDKVVESYATKDFEEFESEGLSFSLRYISCDWNPALRALNDYHDAAIAATKLPTWKQRQAAVTQVEYSIPYGNFPPQTASECLGLLSARGRGKLLSKLMVSEFTGGLRPCFQADNRLVVNRQLTRLGIALAIYRAEQGAYPDTLDELVPGVLSKLPIDLFHNNPFAYRKTDDGYLLYSFGANGTDEGGSNEFGSWGTSKLEGVEVQEPDDFYENESDWDENGEYVGGSMTEPEGDLDNPFAKIPAGADDLSLRVPLPEPDPWPWETE